MAAAYLDHNASAPIRPAAAQAAAAALSATGNPSSVHGAGRGARAHIEAARREIANLAGVLPGEVVFTSGATEANNLALKSSGRPRILVSAIEHVSVLDAAPAAERLAVTGNGVVDLAALEAALAAASPPALVSVMLANNETGVVQPVAEAARLAHRHGALFHCDAVQAPGRIDVAAATAEADYISLSAHKMGGPKGVGALIVRERAPLSAQIAGGGQERGRRGGTENLSGIAGFAAAARETTAALAQAPRIEALRDALEAALRAKAPEIVIFGAGAPRLPNTASFALPGVPAETQVMTLDLAGYAISAGAACSSGKVAPSHVLIAMGAAPRLAGAAIRVSLGVQTTKEEIDGFIDAYLAMRARIRARSAA